MGMVVAGEEDIVAGYPIVTFRGMCQGVAKIEGDESRTLALQ